MSLSVSMVGMSGKSFFEGRTYRLVARYPALGKNDYYRCADEDSAGVFVVTEPCAYPAPIPAQKPSFLPNVDATQVPAISFSIIIEESRRAGGAMSKCGLGSVTLDAAALQRAMKAAERRTVAVTMVDQTMVSVECLISVVVPSGTVARTTSTAAPATTVPATAPTLARGSALPDTAVAPARPRRSAPRKEAAALRQRLAQKQAELEGIRNQPIDFDERATLYLAMQLEAICDEMERDCGPLRASSSMGNRIEHLEAHLMNLERRIARGQHASHQQEIALVQERDAVEIQLAKLDPVREVTLDLKRRQGSLQALLTRLDAECRVRDVSNEAAAALAEHDAMDRALSVLTLPRSDRQRSLPQRFAIVKAELDAKQPTDEITDDTVSLLHEFDILDAAIKKQQTADAAASIESVIPVHHGHEWNVVVAKEANLDHIRGVVRYLSAAPCLEAVRSAAIHPSTFPPLATATSGLQPTTTQAQGAPRTVAAPPQQQHSSAVDDLFR